MRYYDTAAQATDALRAGRLIAHPTSSLPGFAADPLHDGALDRLDSIKARKPGSGYIVISGFLDHFKGWIAACPLTEHLLRHPWDSPMTLIGPAGSAAPQRLRGPADTIAMRLDPHSAVKSLSAALDRPLVSTSLNRPGQPPTRSLEEIEPSLETLLAGVFSTGQPTSGIASTIVVVQDGVPRCLRSGGISMATVCEVASRIGSDWDPR